LSEHIAGKIKTRLICSDGLWYFDTITYHFHFAWAQGKKWWWCNLIDVICLKSEGKYTVFLIIIIISLKNYYAPTGQINRVCSAKGSWVSGVVYLLRDDAPLNFLTSNEVGEW